MTGISFREEDLYSFGGLIVLVPFLVGGIHKLFGPLSKRFSHGLIVGLMMIVGTAVKLTVPASFPGFGIVGTEVGLLLASLAAAQAFDTAAHVFGGDNGTPGGSGPTPPGNSGDIQGGSP